MPAKTFLTVAEAAKRVGKSRQTVFDKIKRGQLSATVNHDGNKVVDVSELLRVFGALLSDDEVKQNQANKSGQSITTQLTSTLQLELERAKLQIERRDFELEQLRQKVDEMRERERTSTDERLRLFGIIERQSLLLAAPAKPAAKPKTASKPVPAPARKAKPAASKAPPPPAVKTPRKAAAAPVVKKATPKAVAKSVPKKSPAKQTNVPASRSRTASKR